MIRPVVRAAARARGLARVLGRRAEHLLEEARVRPALDRRVERCKVGQLERDLGRAVRERLVPLGRRVEAADAAVHARRQVRHVVGVPVRDELRDGARLRVARRGRPAPGVVAMRAVRYVLGDVVAEHARRAAGDRARAARAARWGRGARRGARARPRRRRRVGAALELAHTDDDRGESGDHDEPRAPHVRRRTPASHGTAGRARRRSGTGARKSTPAAGADDVAGANFRNLLEDLRGTAPRRRQARPQRLSLVRYPMPKRAREPVDETAAATLAKQWGLDARLVSRLRALQVAEFFEVQRLVLPRVIAVADAARSSAPCRDICVSAPTGSGKTLVFVLGVLHGLAGGARARASAARPRRAAQPRPRDAGPRRVQPLRARGRRARRPRRGRDLARRRAARARRRARAAAARGDGGAGDGAATACVARRSARARAPSRVASSQPPTPRSSATPPTATPRTPTGATPTPTGATRKAFPRAGSVASDVLVCTPGRLVEHLEGTPGFTLQHVRFLVVDEADRLLSQAYQDWLNKARGGRARAHAAAAAYARERLSASRKSPLPSPPRIGCDVDAGVRGRVHRSADSGRARRSRQRRHGRARHATRSDHDARVWPGASRAAAAASAAAAARAPRARGESEEDAAHPAHGAATAPSIAPSAAPSAAPLALRRLLFSAALTDSPQQLAALRLTNPEFFSLRPSAARDGAADAAAAATAREGGFALPATLREGYVCCETNQKPLALLALLDAPMPGAAAAAAAAAAPAPAPPGPHLVFTSSVDSARRVARLIELARAAAPTPRHGSRGVVAEYSSALTQRCRTELLDRCRAGTVQVRAPEADRLGRPAPPRAFRDEPPGLLLLSYKRPFSTTRAGAGVLRRHGAWDRSPARFARRKLRCAQRGENIRPSRRPHGTRWARGTAVTLVKVGQERRFAAMRLQIDERAVEVFPLADSGSRRSCRAFVSALGGNEAGIRSAGSNRAMRGLHRACRSSSARELPLACPPPKC